MFAPCSNVVDDNPQVIASGKRQIAIFHIGDGGRFK